jgi:heptose I phosphotransferase
MNNDFITAALKDTFSEEHLFSQVDQLQGEVFREVANRRTLKTRIGGQSYFAKIHFGVGWIEIAKNLVQGRLPILGARSEWLALNKLQEAGVPTMTPVLFCETGYNPATRRSAIMTESLENKVTLEDLEPGSPRLKWKLIEQVAEMARDMHLAGVNHRDFYLCHFLMDCDVTDSPVLHLIDLHRAQIRPEVPLRWLVKDLGGLLFSAFEKGLTKRDLLRFVRVYRRGKLRHAFRVDSRFWHNVTQRAKQLYLQDHAALTPEITRLLDE